MSKERKKRNEESPNGKGIRGGSESSNGTGGKGLRSSESPNGKGASAPVAAAANGTGVPSIEDAIREILARTAAVERVEEAVEALRGSKKSKKSCKKSKKCTDNSDNTGNTGNNDDSCWE